MNDKVEVRVKAKLTNAILERFADDCGGRKAAAKKLGVCKATFDSWLNFKSNLRPTKSMTTSRAKRIVLILEQETGRNIRDIFPLTKAELALISTALVEDKVIDHKGLLEFNGPRQGKLSYEEDHVDLDLTGDVTSVLRSLPERQRQVVKLRFGLDGEDQHTYQECATIFGVTHERIRQLERRALDNLRRPNVASRLVGYLD